MKHPSPLRNYLCQWILLLSLCSWGSPASAGDWINLFDGETTKGWTPRAEIVTFEATNKELHLLSTNNVWVTSDIKMANFEVELEVLLPEGADGDHFNSGLAFRCTGEKGKPKGYQCEIEAENPGESGGVYGIGLGGWLYPKDDQQKAEYTKRIEGVLKVGDWNHYRVECDGPKIKTWVNGKLIAELEDSQSLKGYFGIQHHGRGGMVKFRNIRARELTAAPASVEKKPNILWIVAEDMSPTLGCYGDAYATTPNLDKFAKQSVLYSNAFAVAPVCSPSRSCLITGMHPVSMGTNQMRSSFPVPKGVHGFPSYLRDAGFYTTNNVKTDYNNGDAVRITKESWNDSSASAHWRNSDRKKAQPFFAIFNDMTSHQSRTMVWPYAAFQEHVQSKLSADEIHDPAKAPVPPYYPDTPAARKTIARFYDCVTVMDQNVGRILSELEADGLADDTIVFFYSDHGSGMPRHKRLLLDSGMKVPLMIRFPKKYQHFAPAKAGEKVDHLVSFLDFAPTVLALSGVERPDYMQGRVFLGPDTEPEPKYVYGARDRVDEVFDCARSIRSKKYLYIRNYMPRLSYNQPSVFSDLSDIRKEFANTEKMTPEQLAYAGPTRATEEFYDCEADPMNLRNLVEDPNMTTAQHDALQNFRDDFIIERDITFKDVGAIPESIAWDAVQRKKMPLRDIFLEGESELDPKSAWFAADSVIKGKLGPASDFTASNSASQRYWGIVGMRGDGGNRLGEVRDGRFAFRDKEAYEAIRGLLNDPSPPVRIEAASWLAADSKKDRSAALDVLVKALQSDNWYSALSACRAIELLGEKANSVLPVMRKLYDSTRHKKGDETFFIAFSAGAFLDQLGEPTEPWDFTPSAGSFSADPPPENKK